MTSPRIVSSGGGDPETLPTDLIFKLFDSVLHVALELRLSV
jgi:hypothetical protein